MKKNKNKIGIALVIFLSAITFYFNTQNTKGTLKKELTNFAVKDTSSITKIFLADKQNHTVLLERQTNGSWILNKKYQVREDAIKLLLTTMKELSVKAPVGKQAFENVVKRLATSAVKVEIYTNNELSTVYYVGHSTQDYTGTFMMLENSSTPFIMWIPGFEGYLSARYFTDEESWKSTLLFSHPVVTIKSLKIEYPQKPNFSFEIGISNKKLSLKSLLTGAMIEKFDTAMAFEYLTRFKDIHYEFSAKELPTTTRDSVLMRKTMHIISITDINGKIDKLTTYPKLASIVQITQDSTLIYDVDRMYAIHNNDKDLIAVQYYVFDHLLKPIDYFTNRPKK